MLIARALQADGRLYRGRRPAPVPPDSGMAALCVALVGLSAEMAALSVQGEQRPLANSEAARLAALRREGAALHARIAAQRFAPPRHPLRSAFGTAAPDSQPPRGPSDAVRSTS